MRALVESLELIDFIVYLFGKHTINLPIFKKIMFSILYKVYSRVLRFE